MINFNKSNQTDMESDQTTENEVIAEDNGEGEQVETVAVPKKDYDTLNQTLGSLKREIKDLKKSKETAKETPKNQPEESALLQKLEKMSLRQAGITHPDDEALARETAKKWGMDVDDVLLDEDFKVKLEREQTKRTNAEATSNVRGSGSTTTAKNTPEYWIQKGTPPSPTDVSDRKTRAKSIKAMMANASTGGKTFCNE